MTYFDKLTPEGQKIYLEQLEKAKAKADFLIEYTDTDGKYKEFWGMGGAKQMAEMFESNGCIVHSVELLKGELQDA